MNPPKSERLKHFFGQLTPVWIDFFYISPSFNIDLYCNGRLELNNFCLLNYDFIAVCAVQSAPVSAFVIQPTTILIMIKVKKNKHSPIIDYNSTNNYYHYASMTWITPILQSNLWIFRRFSHCVRYRTWTLSRFFFTSFSHSWTLPLALPKPSLQSLLVPQPTRRLLLIDCSDYLIDGVIFVDGLLLSSSVYLVLWFTSFPALHLPVGNFTVRITGPAKRLATPLSLWLQIIVLIYVCTNNHNIIFVTARPQVNRLWLMSPRLVQTILRWLTSNRIAKGEKDGNFTGWAGFSLASRVRGSLRPRALACSQSYGRRSGGGGGSNSSVHLNVYVCVHVVYWDPLSFM